MLWFIKRDVFEQIAAIRRSGIHPSVEQLAAFEKRIAAGPDDPPRILSIVGSEAEILIEGALTKQASYLYYMYGLGRTTYREIQQALDAIAREPAVKRVTLRIASPGGTVDGLFDLLTSLQTFSKSSGKVTRAVVDSAYSAAYGIAAQCSRIEATGPASGFGSVGVATTYAFWDGETLIDLTNTGSEAKRPDPRTDEGRAIIVKELDDYAALFTAAIAKGRTAAGAPIKAAEVIEKYGAGACVLAAEAVTRGMADAIAKPSLRVVRSENDAPEPEAEDTAAVPTEGAPRAPEIETMDLKTLKTAHPEVFEAAFKEGVTAERDRVGAHLTLGKQSGDLETAYKAIEDGSAMTATLQAKYLAAGMNRADKEARQTESDKAAKKIEGANGGGDASGGAVADVGDAVVERMKARDGAVKK